MSTTIQTSERFTALPDERTLADTVQALEGRGFSVEVVNDLDAARESVLARIPEGSSVMTNPSVTLESTGIAQAVNDGERYDSARTKVFALDQTTQLQEIKAIMGQPEFTLGSVHAITRDGTLVIASALGSQLASYAWGAANVIFVVAPAPSRPTGRTVASARSSRSTRRIPAASTSSSSAQPLGSDPGAPAFPCRVLRGVTAAAAVLSCGVQVIFDQGVDHEGVCGGCDGSDGTPAGAAFGCGGS